MAFQGDEKTFFSRDSGLCCRALQSLGVQAKVVMPEPAWNDEADVLRASIEQFCDPGFWRAQEAEAVILYSWAHPKYTSVAEAIHAAGLKLFVNIDTVGLNSPFVEPWAYFHEVWIMAKQKNKLPMALPYFFSRLVWQYFGLHRHFFRLRHMACADAIGVVSPIAAERMRKYARFFGREDIACKIHFVSHPIDSTMQYSGEKKLEQVIAVGRWDDPEKQPEWLIRAAVSILLRNATVRIVIAGKEASRCAAEIVAAVPDAKDRVLGYERLDHDELCRQMSSSQISLCTSFNESFHIASGEALLCGCSAVSPDSPFLPSLPYFIDEGRSGRLSENNPAALADAVLAELVAWKSDQRDAAAIAQIWRERIASQAVVKQIDRLLAETGD